MVKTELRDQMFIYDPRVRIIGVTMLRMKKLTEIYGMKVYTDDGDYFGDVEEVVCSNTKIASWRVRAVRGSLLSKVLGSAKGVIVPHGLVKSIGDIMVISRSAAPALSGSE